MKQHCHDGARRRLTAEGGCNFGVKLMKLDDTMLLVCKVEQQAMDWILQCTIQANIDGCSTNHLILVWLSLFMLHQQKVAWNGML